MCKRTATDAPAREHGKEILDGAFELADNSGVSVTARQMIMPVFCLRAGDCFDAISPLVPPALEKIAA